MPDRQVTWGADSSDARYRSGDDDPTGGGNYVVAERLDGSGNSVDVLLEWDEVNETWQSRGPVEMNGNDITGVGSLTADSVNTGKAEIDDAQLGPLSTGRVINRTIDATTTSSEDLFAVDREFTQHFTVFGSFVRVRGDPSHRIVICKYGNGDAHAGTVDSYRQNSFRNQLAEPTFDSNNDRWVFSSTGTNGNTSGQLELTISGHIPDGGFAEL